MAKNIGRVGRVKERSQFFNFLTRLWVKRDDTTGQIVGDKVTGGKYRDIAVEKQKMKSKKRKKRKTIRSV